MAHFIKVQEDSLGTTFINTDDISHAYIIQEGDAEFGFCWLARLRLITGTELFVWLTDDCQEAAEGLLEHILQHGQDY